MQQQRVGRHVLLALSRLGTRLLRQLELYLLLRLSEARQLFTEASLSFFVAFAFEPLKESTIALYLTEVDATLLKVESYRVLGPRRLLSLLLLLLRVVVVAKEAEAGRLGCRSFLFFGAH